MSEQELNLFQFSARFAAQTGARATKVMGCHAGEATSRAGFLDDAPDHLRAEAVGGNPSRFVDCAKDWAGCDLRFRQPGAQTCLDPKRNRHGPDVTAFAYEISKDPVLFALLQILNGERGQFCPTQPATQENGNHSVIPDAAQRLPIKHLKQAPPLFGREPIPDPNPKFFDALYSANSCGQVRAEQAGVRGFIREAANGGEPKVDGRRSVTGLLEEDPIAGNYGFVERQSGLGAVPVDELANGVVVRALRTLRGEAVRTADFDCSRSGSRKTVLGARYVLF